MFPEHEGSEFIGRQRQSLLCSIIFDHQLLAERVQTWPHKHKWVLQNSWCCVSQSLIEPNRDCRNNRASQMNALAISYTKFWVWWVSRLLTSKQTKSGDRFGWVSSENSTQLVTVSETWIHHHILKTKKQSKLWTYGRKSQGDHFATHLQWAKALFHHNNAWTHSSSTTVSNLNELR